MNPFEDDNVRVIGCEFRVRDQLRGVVREVAMMPLDIDLPAPGAPDVWRQRHGYSFPLTIHTSRGDINVEAYLP